MKATLLAALALLLAVAALAACGGDDDDSADGTTVTETTTATETTDGETDGETGGEPLAVSERVLEGDELAGFSAGETGEWSDASEFAPHYRLVDPAQLGERLAAAGFAGAAGNSLTAEDDDAKQAVSYAIQLSSPETATAEAEWIYANAATPCPPGCGVTARPFEVPGIPNSRGVTLRAPQPTQFGAPFTSHRIFFTDGPFVYTVVASGPPGTVRRADVVAAAEAIFERVEGRPAG